jgi:hypothetical protein
MINIKRSAIIVSLFFTIVSSHSHAEWYISTADPSLVVRDSADVTGKKIGNVPLDGKVNVIEKTHKKDSLSGRSGEWVKIEWENTYGYVFNSFLRSIENSPKEEIFSKDNKSLDSDLINSLKFNNEKKERNGNYGEAIRAYMKEGIVDKKPNQRADYTDYYVINNPTEFMGHELIVIEEEYMDSYIGCCVSPGAGAIIKINGSSENLKNFSKNNYCSLSENIDIKNEMENIGIKKNFPSGNYASLSCRERDIKTTEAKSDLLLDNKSSDEEKSKESKGVKNESLVTEPPELPKGMKSCSDDVMKEKLVELSKKALIGKMGLYALKTRSVKFDKFDVEKNQLFCQAVAMMSDGDEAEYEIRQQDVDGEIFLFIKPLNIDE